MQASGPDPARGAPSASAAADAGQDAPAAGSASEDSEDSAATPSAAAAVLDAARELGRLGQAWLALAREELALARISAGRLVFGWIALVVLALMTWLFACLALGHALSAWIGRSDLAMAAVALLQLALIGVLLVAMRRWRRRLRLPESRAALRELARRLS